MTRVEVFAPAKINLTLHITGRQADGYHLIDSLVAFAPAGDRLVLTEASTHSITVEGPEARGVPANMDNLALKAAQLIRGEQGISITLKKNLPAASGVWAPSGGGRTRRSDSAAHLPLRGMRSTSVEVHRGIAPKGSPSMVIWSPSTLTSRRSTPVTVAVPPCTSI